MFWKVSDDLGLGIFLRPGRESGPGVEVAGSLDVDDVRRCNIPETDEATGDGLQFLAERPVEAYLEMFVVYVAGADVPDPLDQVHPRHPADIGASAPAVPETDLPGLLVNHVEGGGGDGPDPGLGSEDLQDHLGEVIPEDVVLSHLEKIVRVPMTVDQPAGAPVEFLPKW